MSLLILAFLIFTGLILIFLVRANEHNWEENNVFDTLLNLFIGYNVVLFFAALFSIGAGIFWWLKEGVWLSINPSFLLYKIEKGSSYKELLLSNSSWVGIQEINSWYLQQNMAWSFILTIIVLFVVFALTTKQ